LEENFVRKLGVTWLRVSGYELRIT